MACQLGSGMLSCPAKGAAVTVGRALAAAALWLDVLSRVWHRRLKVQFASPGARARSSFYAAGRGGVAWTSPRAPVAPSLGLMSWAMQNDRCEFYGGVPSTNDG